MFFYPTRGSEKHFSPPKTAHFFVFIFFIFFIFIFIFIFIVIFIFFIEDVQGISSC